MSRKKISHSARIKGPSPEQIKKRNLIIGILIVAVVALVIIIAVGMSGGGKSTAPSKQTPPSSTPVTQSAASVQQLKLVQADKSAHRVTIDTARGQIVMEVCPDLMPVTVANFDKLVKEGFYNGLTFHRVEDWVVQGGDPKGNGTGGSGQLAVLHSETGYALAGWTVRRVRHGCPGNGYSRPDPDWR